MAAKFVENEFEKTDRLMELFFQYQGSWQRALNRLKTVNEVDSTIIEMTLQDAGQFMLRQARTFASLFALLAQQMRAGLFAASAYLCGHGVFASLLLQWLALHLAGLPNLWPSVEHE